MNLSYLMQYISYTLHTPVRRLTPFEQQQIPSSWDFLSSFCARPDFQDKRMSASLLRDFLLETFTNLPTIPLIFSWGLEAVYAFCPAPKACFLVGPVRFSSPVSFKYAIQEEPLPPSYVKTIPVCTVPTFASCVLLLYNLFQETPIDNDRLLLFNCIDSSIYQKSHSALSELIFQNREEGIEHNPYQQEVREFASIEQGDLEMLKKSLAEDYVGKVGTLAKSKVRNWRNLSIVVITLAARAAIRGGLLPEIAFSMSDTQIQQIEEHSDPLVLLNLTHEFEFQYTQLVADIKEKKRQKNKASRQNLHVEQCKDYIFKHLHEKILIQDIAEELHLNPNYLSDIFKKYEGTTIAAFILNEKIELAKNLLTYSHYHYSEIAAYLGFSSQSYLGLQFRKSTGMTLKEYRDTHRVFV